MAAKVKIFIDGEAGTTGLQIASRLRDREEFELLQIEASQRKDLDARSALLNASDIAILCLPDAAARESVALIENDNTCVIDASTAHRTEPGWTYGFVELHHGQRAALKASKRIANPGCYAIGAISMLRPLINGGIVPPDWPVSVQGLSGYSGGGNALIAAFESVEPHEAKPDVYDYALGLNHKHLPEMKHWTGLARAPVFLPSVGRFYKGMLVHLPLPLWALPTKPSAGEVHAVLRDYYAGEQFVQVTDFDAAANLGELDPQALNDSNRLVLTVLHNDESEQAIIVAQLDNLGKGASGQVVQTINLLSGLAEASGL